jgi:AcrR family transcriptional regulator
MSVAPTAKPTPSRRRKRPHQAILAATVELLETEGYKALTIEGIAQKAGVGKQTIYRWWPSKAAIVMEAYAQKAYQQIPLPDHGSVYLDLQELLKRLFLVLTTTSAGAVMSNLMAEAQIDLEFAQAFRDDFIATRRQAMCELLERGRDRGELRADVDLELVIDTLYGPMWYRLLNKHAPLDNQFAKELVDQLRVGIGISASE